MKKNRFFINHMMPEMAREYDKDEKQSLHSRTQKTKLRKAMEDLNKELRRKRGY